jgi:FdhD protein
MPRARAPADLAAGVRLTDLRRFPALSGAPESDCVVVEEPLEIRVGGETLATVMRTPCDDIELALGFLFAEGVIDAPDDVGALALCVREPADAHAPAEGYNVAVLLARAGLDLGERLSRRHGPAVSSCGVCGKRSIDEAIALRPPPGGVHRTPSDGVGWLDPATLAVLPEHLRAAQALFARTGALHAAGVFDSRGDARYVREDIGRHNAVDKVVGAAFLDSVLPLACSVLQVSGRVSFEIVQKAYRAGVPVVAAVSGVSSLAIEMAARVGMTLAGFVRERRFSVYADGGHLARR